MKKILMTGLAALTFSTVAHAGSLHLDFRVDANGTNYNDEAKDVFGLSDSSRIYFKTGRLDYKGTLNEQISYRVRWAFTKNANVAAKDSTVTGVELAYLTHKMSDLFSLTIGKFNSEIGGFEAATSGADLYLTSENYTRSALTRAPAGGATSLNDATNLGLLYQTGVKGTFSFSGQDIHIVVTDNASDDSVNTWAGSGSSTSATSTQNRGLYGVVWKGSFLNKSLSPVVSYFELSPQNKSADSKNTLASAGLKFDFEPISAYVEYHISDFKDGATDDKDTLSSIVAKIAYTGWEEWVPRLEFFSSEDKREIGGSTKDKYLGYGAVVEYIPKKSETFRYHAAVNMVDEDREGSDNVTKTEFILGARLMADFLK